MNVKVGDINLDVLKIGARSDLPTLVFLHYFGGSSQSWRGVIDALENDFYCLAPDLRGFGKSQDGASFEIEDYAQDIIDLTDALDVEGYILIGHSMGGKIALEIAARKPEGLRSLVLFAPSPPTPEPMAEEEREKLLTTHGTKNAAEETIVNGVSRTLSSTVLADAVEANLQSSEAAWKAWLEVGSRRNIAPLMGEIEVPIFAAVGADDENMTAELIEREIVSCVEIGELSIIENARHLLPLEAAKETAAIIRSAVEKTLSADFQVKKTKNQTAQE